jgi:hypothetical protein
VSWQRGRFVVTRNRDIVGINAAFQKQVIFGILFLFNGRKYHL